MNLITRGFHGRRGGDPTRVPPGQYETHDFPVLTVGPTPRVDTATWTFTVTTETGARHQWTWNEFMALPQERPHVDIHCVTRWSRLDTDWVGVCLDTLLEDVETTADYALAHCYGGYTTNLPLQDLTDGQAWIAHTFDGEPLAPEHGGPARLIVPHLYFWKSAKWVKGLTLLPDDEPGFWEQAGYHDYGDPWREQRYRGD
ncbi:molybdopterin-dependent oxidoreductase [Nocardiopsis metallicus]|uniref:DMSO/TMAO reductase YedYZ molybdopterin-dependent catalytic subunit n=1 Tax=Nocardiopsis metallicus TaxID=179819 RepID=A0A840WYA1_9ACTN|nr:molybdopterin-dependent oxidoreductase [Nocardiopsis metallicus]MBB5495158.1 DMSO/TMAO reductase YedYZ molybdopterin-dependent catalytic subunit [Nocardiopsis metallicus]